MPACLQICEGDIIARVQAARPDDPWHGNTLLSCGPERFQPADVVKDDGKDLTLANYSMLATPGRLQIATERSGITIPQIQALLDFMYNIIGLMSSEGLWTGTFGDEHGRPLSFETFNLYHADEWIIRPATAAGAHHPACSYVELLGIGGTSGSSKGVGPQDALSNVGSTYQGESGDISVFFKMATHLLLLSSLLQRVAACCTLRLVAENAEAQLPLWFVSHAWLEPIKLFLACLRCHAVIRDLQVNGAKPPAYWVCAYANNQHILGEAISDNPRKTSFFKAMQLCQGVLLVLDMLCTPFTRIWCCFEESIAVEHLVSDRF